MKKSIKFIQNPESLTKVNLSEIRGGKSISDEQGCVAACAGSTCQAQFPDGADGRDISIC